MIKRSAEIFKNERKCAPSKRIAIRTDKNATERPTRVGFISARVPAITGFYKKILSHAETLGLMVGRKSFVDSEIRREVGYPTERSIESEGLSSMSRAPPPGSTLRSFGPRIDPLYGDLVDFQAA
ncbi:hypothetical protein EHQ67_07610 [Leptospira kmetyi]|nr:hypothetical protein EHQ67_07610 [Leptospira kmetyi]